MGLNNQYSLTIEYKYTVLYKTLQMYALQQNLVQKYQLFLEKKKRRKERDSLQLLVVGFGFGWGRGHYYRRGGSFQPKLNYQKQFQFSQVRIFPDKNPNKLCGKYELNK